MPYPTKNLLVLNQFIPIINKTIPILLLSLFLVVCQITLVSGQNSESRGQSLAGTVNDVDGQPLSYATVAVGGGKGSQTDDQGRFFLTGLTEGVHRVTVSLVGFETERKDVQVVAGRVVEVAFILQTGNALSEVIITAGRKPESLKDVPSSVSILTARDIKEQLAVNPSIAAILGNNPRARNVKQ